MHAGKSKSFGRKETSGGKSGSKQRGTKGDGEDAPTHAHAHTQREREKEERGERSLMRKKRGAQSARGFFLNYYYYHYPIHHALLPILSTHPPTPCL